MFYVVLISETRISRWQQERTNQSTEPHVCLMQRSDWSGVATPKPNKGGDQPVHLIRASSSLPTSNSRRKEEICFDHAAKNQWKSSEESWESSKEY